MPGMTRGMGAARRRRRTLAQPATFPTTASRISVRVALRWGGAGTTGDIRGRPDADRCSPRRRGSTRGGDDRRLTGAGLGRTQPQRVSIREKDFGIWREYSWEQTWGLIEDAAHGLLALGVEPGDRV